MRGAGAERVTEVKSEQPFPDRHRSEEEERKRLCLYASLGREGGKRGREERVGREGGERGRGEREGCGYREQKKGAGWRGERRM